MSALPPDHRGCGRSAALLIARARGDADQALETYLALSETIPEAVDLIVWPEVAVPDSLNQRPDMLARLGEHAHRQSAWLIVGGFEFAEGRVFNSLYVFSPDGVHTETYRKVILVPRRA